ncbi:MAG: biotin/lipoyl-binding protein, partial [Devosia sp.]
MTDFGIRSFGNESRSLRWHGLVGFVAVFGLFGGFTLWASQTEISGAVAAPGSVVVEGFAKKIQHQDGGIVKAFYVRDGDVVVAGQLLAELDDTAIAANLAVLDTQVREASLRQAREIAEI